MKTHRIVSFCLLFVILCTGCIDIKMGMGDIGIVDRIAVSSKGGIALCMDEDIYITDFNGSHFERVTKDSSSKGSISWSFIQGQEGLLYVEKPDKIWTLNLYNKHGESSLLLQEMDRIAMPVASEEFSYIVLPDEEKPFGNINIYEKDSSRIYTLFENAYYDYEWLPNSKKIAAINVNNVNENSFSGVLLIKDINDLSEEIIYSGTFYLGKDYLDITEDNNIIFSSCGEIYLYNIEAKMLSKWYGAEGYDYRLPSSVNSSLKGYIIAKVKGGEEGWNGQLYLVNPRGHYSSKAVLPSEKFIPIPGWPFWMDEKKFVCMNMENYDIIVKDRLSNEIVDITERFEKNGIKKE